MPGAPAPGRLEPGPAPDPDLGWWYEDLEPRELLGVGELLQLSSALVISGHQRGAGADERRTGVALAGRHRVGSEGLDRPVREGTGRGR